MRLNAHDATKKFNESYRQSLVVLVCEPMPGVWRGSLTLRTMRTHDVHGLPVADPRYEVKIDLNGPIERLGLNYRGSGLIRDESGAVPVEFLISLHPAKGWIQKGTVYPVGDFTPSAPDTAHPSMWQRIRGYLRSPERSNNGYDNQL